MKKMISILFIILLVPFLALAQEAAPAEPKPEEPKKEAEQPESFFNDLISNLNSGTEVKKEAAKPAEGLPAPDPAPILPVQEETKPEPIKTVAPLPVPAKLNPEISGEKEAEPVKDNVVLPVKDSSPVVPESDTPAPTDVKTIAPQPVASPEIVIGKKGGNNKKNKEKKEKVKKEREKKDIVPFVEPPEAKSKSQKKYVKAMEKLPKSRMRLITLDPADHVFSRKYRSPELALYNSANLGVRAEKTNTFSIIPINTFELDLKTSTKPLVLLEEYFSTGELLTPAREDSMIAMLGPDGLELPLDINMPTLVNIKMGLLGGSIFANAGLFVKENMTIPGSLFGIILDGATVDEPYVMDDDLGVSLNVYAKGSAGYGTFVELPLSLGEVRFGATVNAYAGAFSDVNITNIEFAPSTDGIRATATAEILSFADISFMDESGFNPQFNLPATTADYLAIPGINLGYDFGVAWRFKLNRILPIAPKILKNYFDFQIGIEDLGAKISMNNAYLRQMTFEMEAGDLLNTFMGEFNMDSMMVVEETTIYEDTTITRPLGTKMNMSLVYQPIPQLLLKVGTTSFLSEGLNSNTGQNYFYGAEIYPVPSFCIHGSVTQKGHYRFSEAGIKLYNDSNEFGLKVRVYDLDFSFTENVSGAGLQFNWVRYF